MKFLHLSDLHLGKRVNGFSMLEEQAAILIQLRGIIADEKPDGILIAGDVYDKPVPPTEAVQLFDDFLAQLSGTGQRVFLISGNHDSPERLAFGGRLMQQSGIYLSPVYDGTVVPIPLEDAYGTVNVYLLPFLKPASIRRFYENAPTDTYTAALHTALSHLHADTTQRNVLVTHQFVTGAARCESEELSVGGTDNVDAAVFDDFDYVALGHIHGPQRVSRDTLRYCGSPLKYSFSEVNHKKSVTVVELLEKGEVTVRTVPLTPQRDFHELRGSYAELTERSYYTDKPFRNSYLHITLTDEEDIPNAVGKLHVIYPYLMKLDYDNTRTRSNPAQLAAPELPQQTPQSLFSDFYAVQNDQPLSKAQNACLAALISEIWEDAT